MEQSLCDNVLLDTDSRSIVLIGTDGRNGGAQQTVWEVPLGVGGFNDKAKEEDQGALASVLDLAKAFERVSLPGCLLGQRTSTFEGRSCECCAGNLSTRGECSSKDVRRNRFGPSRPSCQGPSGSVCFCVLLQDALSEATPPLKLMVFVDDITALS